MRSTGRLALAGLGLAAAAGGVCAYVRWLRPYQMHWGATDEEVARPLPGDEVVGRPHFDATRALTIAAPPAAVWPWLVQIGSKRAGWYSYDWLDNARIPSSWEILPEFQHIEVGAFVPTVPDREIGLWVKAFEVERYILWWDKKGDATWLWWLEPDEDGSTRLLVRLRTRYSLTPWWLVPYWPLFDVGDIVMMRRCMLGIRARAEAAAREGAPAS